MEPLQSGAGTPAPQADVPEVVRRHAGGTGRSAYEWDETALLGPGGHGRVHPGTGADGGQVAVKVVRLRTDSTRRWLEEAVLSEREWDVARRLTPRPTHLLPALDAFHDGDDFVLVMPRADGSLKDRLEAGQVLDAAECRDLLRDAATGLQQLHTAGVLHRDVKPGNVLRWQDKWVLGDFGVARIVDAPADGVTWRGTGTPEYWAPEYARTHTATFQTDLYALGCTALEALTGVTPVRGADLEAEHRRLMPGGAAGGDPVLDRVLHDLLNKDPSRRPRDARQVVEALSPPRGLGEAQKGLLRLAAAASRRDAEHSMAASVAEQANERRAEALRVLDGLWTRLERLVTDLGLPVRTLLEDEQRHLVLGGARLTVSAFPPAGAGEALLLGRVTVRDDSGGAASATCPANVVCSWTDGPYWEHVVWSAVAGSVSAGDDRLAIGPSRRPGQGGLSLHPLELMWPRRGHTPTVEVDCKPLTEELLAQEFVDEMEARANHP
jgi:serine/threonine-protein kinase